MYTIHHAERAIQQDDQTEKKLRRYNIAILQQLCDKRGIQVDKGGSRPLKKPYIDALLIHEPFVIVRVYQRRKDPEHTHETECALTPDSGLDLVGLSQKLNVNECQVTDPLASRPWFSKRPILEDGAIRLLKAKEGYLRVICQPNSPLAGDQRP